LVGRPGIADRFILRFGRDTAHLPSVALAVVAGAAGGWLAKAVGAPLPWLIGSLLVVTALAVRNVRPFGHTVGAPTVFRTISVPVIGVSIGAAFTPEILDEAARWWPSALALFLYIPLAHTIGFLAARRVGGVDAPTAYYGMMPGGFIESIALGDAAGADAALLATFQFLRLILCIVLIPIGFTLATGDAVGSASGVVIGGEVQELTPRDWAVLLACGVAGGVAGKKLGLPAGIVTGPILLSGLAHVLGWVHGGPPRWLIDATQLIFGITLGTRFAGRSADVLLTGIRVLAVSLPVTLLLAAAFSVALHRVVNERWEAVFLAFAPGGLAEMALIALSLEISVIYVTVHHVARILLAVFVARAAEARFLR
jgi:uncharacterized protein